ncbi:hypothetical protein PRIPAC_92745, partial [Pristionchus pacificus]
PLFISTLFSLPDRPMSTTPRQFLPYSLISPSSDRESDGSPHTDRHKSTTPHKERDGVHVKDLGRDFLKLFKRKKKKDQSPHPPHLPPPSSPAPSSDTQKEDASDPVSFAIQHLPSTSPVHSEVTQHSADARSVIHVATSATSMTEITSTGATSGESVDHDNSVEDNKKKAVREERRAFYRSQGIHIVADEDDTTDHEESHCPFRVDRRLIDRLQWKDGVTPVEFGKLRKPRFVKRREDKDGEKLKQQPILMDAIPLGVSRKRSRERIGSKEDLKDSLSPMQSPMTATSLENSRKRNDKKKKDDDGLSPKNGRPTEATPLAVSRKRSKEEKKEELKDAVPLEDKKKSKDDKKKDEEDPMSRRKKKSRNNGSAEEGAIEDESDQEKRRRRKGDEGMKDGLPVEDRRVGRKKESDADRKKEEKVKEEKKKEEKSGGGDEGKKKEAKGGEKDNEKKEGRKEKQMEGKKDEDGEIKGERELREARRKEEEKIGDKDNEGPKSDDRLAVVPYEKWPVPAILETIDGYTGYRVLSTGYKTAYFGYVCMHVSYSFVSHLLSFDFNRSVPPSISQKLLTPTEKSKPEKRDESKSPSQSTTPQSNTPRSTKRIVIKTPVEYSNLSVHSSDSVDVAMCN